MSIQLPPLPYALDGLQPYVSARTLEFHHGKHHRAYVDKVNEFTAGTPLAGANLVEIVRAAHAKGDHKLFNQAGQAWNHDFFWPCMKAGGRPPSGRLAELLDRDLGGVEGFREAFQQEGETHFASGWAWLCLKGGKLVVTSLHDGDTPLVHDELQPLLTCDLWEHAYYLDYQNRRPDFLKAFLEHLVDWDFAAHNLELAEHRKAA